MMDRDTWTDAPAPPSVGNLPDDILIAPVFPKAPASPRLSSLRPDGPPSYRPAKLTQPGDSSSLIPALSGVPKGLPAWAMTALGVGVGAILAALTTIL